LWEVYSRLGIDVQHITDEGLNLARDVLPEMVIEVDQAFADLLNDLLVSVTLKG
jgi:hypothetical protein